MEKAEAYDKNCEETSWAVLKIGKIQWWRDGLRASFKP